MQKYGRSTEEPGYTLEIGFSQMHRRLQGPRFNGRGQGGSETNFFGSLVGRSKHFLRAGKEGRCKNPGTSVTQFIGTLRPLTTLLLPNPKKKVSPSLSFSSDRRSKFLVGRDPNLRLEAAAEEEEEENDFRQILPP